MEIQLTSFTKNPLNTVYSAARTCTSTSGFMANLIDSQDVSKKKKANLVKLVIDSKHLSVLEHINLSFSITGVSRTLSHQLVRHRICSVSQQSMRYVSLGDFKYVIPPSIKNNFELLKKYNDFMFMTNELYSEFTDAGIKPEDARFVLPNATETNLAWTVNLREFIHICNERLCTTTQWEFRQMVNEMVDEIANTEEFNFILDFLKPKCYLYGGCNERKNCGLYTAYKLTKDAYESATNFVKVMSRPGISFTDEQKEQIRKHAKGED